VNFSIRALWDPYHGAVFFLQGSIRKVTQRTIATKKEFTVSCYIRIRKSSSVLHLMVRPLHYKLIFYIFLLSILLIEMQNKINELFKGHIEKPPKLFRIFSHLPFRYNKYLYENINDNFYR